MQYAAKSHIGLVRQLNEDGYAIAEHIQPFGVAVIADGMGGHLAGEVASSLAVETVVKHIETKPDTENFDPLDLLAEAMQAANGVVYERSCSSQGLSGMGTTLVAAMLSNDRIYLGHIGDSRGYLFHDGVLRQLTDDHTYVNELFKTGKITAEEMIFHPQRNIVTRAVGTDKSVQADLSQLDWAEGDILLLCSDGLTNMVSTSEITEVLLQDTTLEAKVDQLIDRALNAGGADNITVVAVQNLTDRGVAT